MSWRDRFYDVIAEMLRDQLGVDAVQVTGFEDYTYYGGHCETCAYSETNCKITYVDSHGYEQEYNYSDSFASLIQSLDSQTRP